MKINFLRMTAALIGLSFAPMAFADQPLVPTLAEPIAEELAPIPAEPEVAAPIQGSAPVATVDCGVQALKFTVYGTFDQCGDRRHATGLRGAWNNRPRSCNVRGIVAETTTSFATCDDCVTREKARQIRIDGRLFRRQCDCPEYIVSLARDLGSSSQRVRNAADRNLFKCGYEVVQSTVCAVGPLPQISNNLGVQYL